MKSFRPFAVSILGAAAVASACGPWLPPLLLVDSKQQALRPPIVNLAEELPKLPDLPKLSPGIKPHAYDATEYRKRRYGETVWNEGESADLAAALVFYKVPAAARKDLTTAYETLRTAMAEYRNSEFNKRDADPDAREILLSKLPAGLPAEIADYLKGAIDFHTGFYDEAKKEWSLLLSRPLAERKFRSTWAAYMLARMEVWNVDPEKPETKVPAEAALQRVRSLAQEGCEDGLNLVSRSYYWEGVIQGDADDAKTARLFGSSVVSGSSWGIGEFMGVGYAILDDPKDERRERAVHDPLLRQLVSECAVDRLSDSGIGQVQRKLNGDLAKPVERWLETVKSSALKDVDSADRLAWAAYKLGQFSVAESWVKSAPENSALGNWLRAKLALRSGRENEAAEYFARAVKSFSPPSPSVYPLHDWGEFSGDSFASQTRQCFADQGILQLSRCEFPKALDSLLHSGYWLDAAYVAENLLTTDELLSYVRRHAPRQMTWPASGDRNADDRWLPYGSYRDDIWQATSYLLARRLAREERLSEAREFMPKPLIPRLDEYRKVLEKGRDRRGSADVRSEALWQAARIHRYLGMELFGTETAPDWSYYEGEFECDDFLAVRSGGSKSPEDVTVEALESTDSNQHKLAWIPAVATEEIQRAREHRVHPDSRYHYRYKAAELGWQAAHLRGGDERSALMLCIAGGWLKNRDSESADRFYQDLVNRCGKTNLGIEGEKKRWFPPVNDEQFQK